MKRVAAACLACACLFALAASARRQPAPGGRATVSLPTRLLEEARRAHLYAPILEPANYVDEGERLAFPPLAGFEGWRSDVLKELRANDGGRKWRLVPRAANAGVVAAAVKRCLSPRAGEAPRSWPARALVAAGVKVTVSLYNAGVELVFDRPVGVAPDLLAGCLLEPENGSPTGAFSAMASNLLAGRPGGTRGPPLLALVELRGGGQTADLTGGSPQAGNGAALLAPFPDVILLAQSSAARTKDPFQIDDDGLGDLYAGLGAELLIDVYWAGRGRAADGLLPPGVAPARPLTRVGKARRPGPLSLGTLPPGAPTLPIWVPADDALLGGVAERLAVLLRANGYALDQRSGPAGPLSRGVELVRWRPPTQDPALALLTLAGERAELRSATPGDVLKDPRLLSADADERLAAALALERRWQESRMLVPLMTAQSWFGIDPGLRGVRVRADGVPLLDDAYWGGRE